MQYNANIMENAANKEIIAKTLHKVKGFMLREKLVPPNGRLLLAVSGGVDSVVMTDIMQKLAPELKLGLHIAHLNHCLRGPFSQRDEDFVRNLAQARQIPVTVQVSDVAAIARNHKGNIEEAARQTRYIFFLVTAYKENCGYIATAHHMRDNAESILINLIRGAGLTGLEGIRPKREDLQTRGYPVVRPLLCLDRPEIEAYALACKLEHVFDHTNDHMDLTRNRVRHELLPLLEDEFNPKIVKAVTRLGRIAREENEGVTQLAEQWLNANLAEIEYGLSLPLAGFNALPQALRRRVARQAILRVRQHLLGISLKHVESIVELAQNTEPLKRTALPRNMLAVKRGQRLEIIKPVTPLRQFVFNEENPDYEFKLEPGETLPIDQISMRFKCSLAAGEIAELKANSLQNTAFFDINKITLPLTVRNWRPGDVFAPLGLNGRVKLAKFFINNKITLEKRKTWPLVLDAGGEILWVAGLRLGRAAAINGPNAKLIKVEALPY